MTRLKPGLLLPLTSLTFSLLLLSACNEQSALPTEAGPQRAAGLVTDAQPASEPNATRITRIVDNANTKLAEMGSKTRVGYPWMFRVGQGVDPFGSLRTGNRWTYPNVTYMLDASDFTSDVPAAEVEKALTSAYQSWNDISNTYISAMLLPDNGKNNDIYDNITRNKAGECVDLFDYSADTWVHGKKHTLLGVQPAADIVVGGWLSPEYFRDCLGSEDIIAVTWTFFGPDTNGDHYDDIQFVEQYYNSRFKWTTTDAVYLDFDAPMDIESISVHEDGHALGLGHFGGPIVDQQFKIKGQDKVFDPEAVMNPYYIGGEKRTPFSTDVSGLTTLYTGLGGN